MNNTFWFIHIPKTGGTFVNKNIVSVNKNVYSDEHSRCITDKKIYSYTNYKWDNFLLNNNIFNKSIKFTIIRNPYDFLVSYYLSRWGDFDLGMKNKLPKFKNFEEFIENYCNPKVKWHEPLLKKNIYFQLFDNNGNSNCNFAIRFEGLNENLDFFCKKFNLNFIKTNKINQTHKRKNTDYKKYYNSKLIKMVKVKCKTELEMFDYEFNKSIYEKNIINILNLKINI